MSWVPPEYVPLLVGFFTATMGIIGIILGLTVTYKVSLRNLKTKRTIDLFKEFYSADMGLIRLQAHAFVRNNPVANYEEYKFNIEAKPLWEVMYFYQRLAKLYLDGMLLNNVLVDWFGETFVWWYGYTFTHELRPASWNSFSDIDKLYSAMKWRCVLRRKLWKHWNDRAANDRRNQRQSNQTENLTKNITACPDISKNMPLSATV